MGFYIYNKRPYDSESDDSNNGARCCLAQPEPPNECPIDPDPNLALIGYTTYVPAPYDATENGLTNTALFTPTTTAVVPLQIDIPSRGDDTPFGCIWQADPINRWIFKYFISFDGDRITLEANYTVTNNVVVALNGEPYEDENAIDITLVEQDGNLPFLPSYEIRVVLPTTIGQNDGFLLETQFQINLKYVHPEDEELECPEYSNIWTTSIEKEEEETELPIALYQVRAGNVLVPGTDNWQTVGPFGSITDCENAQGDTYTAMEYNENGNNVTTVDLYWKHYVNQAYWDENHPGFNPDYLQLILFQKGPGGLPWISFDYSLLNGLAQGGSQGMEHVNNQGAAFPFSWEIVTNEINWPRTSRLIESGIQAYDKSVSWEAPATPWPPTQPGTTATRWYLTPNWWIQGTFALGYFWTDTRTNTTHVHYTTKRIEKGRTLGAPRSELRPTPTTSIGSPDPPQVDNEPYAQTYTTTLKAATPSGTMQYVLNPAPNTVYDYQFSQTGTIFTNNINPTTGGQIDYSNFTGTTNEIFTLVETARNALDSVVEGIKTYIVTLTPPNPPRIIYTPTQQKCFMGTPSGGTINASGIGSYVFFKDDNPLIFYVSQDTDLNRRPVIWIPYTKVANPDYTPRIQFDAAFLAQPNFNNPATVLGDCVWANGTTTPFSYNAGSNSLVGTAANQAALGAQMVGFRFNNIPAHTGTSAAQFAIFSSFATNFYRTTEPTTVTAASLFTFNSLGNGLTTPNLFQQADQQYVKAGSLKGLTNGMGYSTFVFTKANKIPGSIAALVQGQMAVRSPTGTTTMIQAVDTGTLNFTVAMLKDYVPFAEDATTITYAFEKQSGAQGLMRGFQWWPM